MRDRVTNIAEACSHCGVKPATFFIIGSTGAFRSGGGELGPAAEIARSGACAPLCPARERAMRGLTGGHSAQHHAIGGHKICCALSGGRGCAPWTGTGASAISSCRGHTARSARQRRLGQGRSLLARPAGCARMWADHPAVEDQLGLLFPFFVFLMPTRSSDPVSTSIAVIARKGSRGPGCTLRARLLR